MSISRNNLLMLIILCASLASCSPQAAPSTAEPTATGAAQLEAPGVQTTMAGATLPVATSSARPAPPATALSEEKSSTATPPGSQGTAVAAFGDPVAIGRGGIRDASFSPDPSTLAIGWTNGVSLTKVQDQIDL